jgi:hypothetical protein
VAEVVARESRGSCEVADLPGYARLLGSVRRIRRGGIHVSEAGWKAIEVT